MAATNKHLEMYSDKPALTASILKGLTEGKTLTSICKCKGMPHIGTFYRWVEKDIGLREAYVRARDRQADTLADQIIDIADSEDDPAKARNQIETRKWRAGKIKPKKYGDLKQLEVTGVFDFSNMTDDQVQDRLTATMAQHGLVTDSATPLIEDTQRTDIIDVESVDSDD